MGEYQIYLTLAILVFGVNVIPVLMPPTWMILAFFYTHYDLKMVPTVVLGAGAATLGRVVLAHLARLYGRKIVPKKLLANYESLGAVIKRNQVVSIPLIFTYAFFPVSSNVVYIVAGLSEIDVRLIAMSFLIGRLMSYSFWITAAHVVSESLDRILIGHFSSAGTIVAELVSVGLILLIGSLNWSKIFKLK